MSDKKHLYYKISPDNTVSINLNHDSSVDYKTTVSDNFKYSKGIDEYDFEELQQSLAKKLSGIRDNLPQVIKTLQRFKDHITSYWNELGTLSNDKSNFDIAHKSAPNIILKYRDQLTEAGLQKHNAEMVLVPVVRMASMEVRKVREDYLNVPFGKEKEIVPPDSFIKQIEINIPSPEVIRNYLK